MLSLIDRRTVGTLESGETGVIGQLQELAHASHDARGVAHQIVVLHLVHGSTGCQETVALMLQHTRSKQKSQWRSALAEVAASGGGSPNTRSDGFGGMAPHDDE